MVVGLTGGIGSGKSIAADHFAALGATVIDADTIAHELTGADGAAMPAIAQAFGPDVVTGDGSLDRAAMRRLIFADPARRKQLESLLHPMIRAASDERRQAALDSRVPYVLMVVPLLVEAPKASRGRFDYVVAVDCPEDLQIQRVMRRSGLTEGEVKAIMATQASRQQRLDEADDVIVNDNGLDHLRTQVQSLHAKYCAEADKLRQNG